MHKPQLKNTKPILGLSLSVLVSISTISLSQGYTVIEEGLTEEQAIQWRKDQAKREQKEAAKINTQPVQDVDSPLTLSTPAPFSQQTGWFAELGAGYLSDFDEAFYQARLGKKLGNGWSYYLQYLYTSKNLFESDDTGSIEIDFTFHNISLGASYEQVFSQSLSAEFGASIGFSYSETEAVEIDPFFVVRDEISDTLFYADAFIRLNLQLTENLSAYAGGRVVYVSGSDVVDAADDVGLFSFPDFGFDAGVKFSF